MIMCRAAGIAQGAVTVSVAAGNGRRIGTGVATPGV